MANSNLIFCENKICVIKNPVFIIIIGDGGKMKKIFMQ